MQSRSSSAVQEWTWGRIRVQVHLTSSLVQWSTSTRDASVTSIDGYHFLKDYGGETSKYLSKFDFGNSTMNIYQAPDLWNTKIGGLISGVVVKYRGPGSPRFYEFVNHRNEIRKQNPMGQTSASNATLQGLKTLDAVAILLAGDLSYVDGFLYAWDCFGILLKASYGPSVPTISCAGDHEVWYGEHNSSFNIPHDMNRWCRLCPCRIHQHLQTLCKWHESVPLAQE